jgi:hypothetical protein
MVGQVLEAPSKYTAAVRMARQVVNVSSKDVDKDDSFRHNSFDQFLDHLHTV